MAVASRERHKLKAAWSQPDGSARRGARQSRRSFLVALTRGQAVPMGTTLPLVPRRKSFASSFRTVGISRSEHHDYDLVVSSGASGHEARVRQSGNDSESRK